MMGMTLYEYQNKYLQVSPYWVQKDFCEPDETAFEIVLDPSSSGRIIWLYDEQLEDLFVVDENSGDLRTCKYDYFEFYK